VELKEEEAEFNILRDIEKEFQNLVQNKYCY
jgi:hypothetical protein